jgi:uncharacterized protein
MQHTDSGIVFSATDVARFLGCRHRTGLDLGAALGEIERQYRSNKLLDVLKQRGLEHEKAYIASLRTADRTVVDLHDVTDTDVAAEQTLDAMRSGADVIAQAVIRDGAWLGKPDILQRVATPSSFGAWSYEVADTKLSRETRAGTILQLGLYSELLAKVQRQRPEYFHVITPKTVDPVESYRVDDYSAYFRLVRERLVAAAATGHVAIRDAHYPEPVDECDVCNWLAVCGRRRRQDDHLSLVAGITTLQRRELESRAVATLSALAGLPAPIAFTPKRGSVASYERVRHQAHLQLASRGRMPPLHELLIIEHGRGLCRLPEPTPGDLFLDFEGDPFAAGGEREYLFGVVDTAGVYHKRWALTVQEEKDAFEWLMDLIANAVRLHPGMHVYHYAPYEPTAFRHLMGRHATRESEVDAMLRAGRFVDLYAVVRQGVRAGVERYSIKNLEPLYDFERDVDLADANSALRSIECALETNAIDTIDGEVREAVEGYNRDDCLSALRLRDWLEALRSSVVAGGTVVPRQTIGDGAAPESVDDQAKAVAFLRERLLFDVPADRMSRSAEQQGRWILAYLLDYHRREERSTWAEYYRLCGLPEEDLYDERAAIADLTFVATVDRVLHKRTGKPTGSVVDRYSYPEQEVEVSAGDKLKLQDETSFGEVAAHDRVMRTIDIKKGPGIAAQHPRAVFCFDHVPSNAIRDSLMRIGEAVAAGSVGPSAAEALLAMSSPRLKGGSFAANAGESASDFAVRIACALDRSVLAIQGPPGAGKTYCGARMICALVRAGKRVGVTATSHKVIRHLLDEVVRAARETASDVRIVQKIGDEDPDPSSVVREVKTDKSVSDLLGAGAVDVAGGTAWLWSNPLMANAVDVLFIDEAGQMSLANAVATAPAANSMVLLGDPQQLEQPTKGAHPDGVGLSALEHMLGTHRTIPAERGIFLPETWRLAPSVCAFTSEIFYEGRLASRPGLERQRLHVDGFPAAGLLRVDVGHDGNRNHSAEEVDVVAALVRRLLADGAAWTDDQGVEHAMTSGDVLIVAPYNAQVARLTERLSATGIRIGTVDKFQGQEAPVVIYSMATSRPEDAPRGMEFLYSLNRLNVASSRAKCLAVLVASPRLFEPDCRSPRQMKLANALCRFSEIAASEAKEA